MAKTRVRGLSVSDDFVIRACVVLIQLVSITIPARDGRTDSQTDRRRNISTMAIYSALHCAIS